MDALIAGVKLLDMHGSPKAKSIRNYFLLVSFHFISSEDLYFFSGLQGKLMYHK